MNQTVTRIYIFRFETSSFFVGGLHTDYEFRKRERASESLKTFIYKVYELYDLCGKWENNSNNMIFTWR